MTLVSVQFQVETPCQGEVPSNIEHALSLGLPEADAKPIHRLNVIANGPSAVEFFAVPRIGDTLAINGALKLFNRPPTYWAACDPQRDAVLSFLEGDLPTSTVYLVASKCHPDVFKRLEGYDVRLWHISDYPIPSPVRTIPTASSVTLVAFTLMRRLGYRAFDVWGWDGCYIDGKHHAAEQTMTTEADMILNVGGRQTTKKRRLTRDNRKLFNEMGRLAKQLGLEAPQPTESTITGGRTFQTTRTWALEAQDAVRMLHLADYEVKIHADGMIKALLEDTGYPA